MSVSLIVWILRNHSKLCSQIILAKQKIFTYNLLVLIFQSQELPKMRVEHNRTVIGDSPKFVRRSMSPIDFINTPEYKAKLKQREIQVEFRYMNDSKLEKTSIKRRDKNINKQRIPTIVCEKEKAEVNQQASFIKHAPNDISGFERSVSKYSTDQTHDTDFFKHLDQESMILKNQLLNSEELSNARTKIFALETDLEASKTKLEEQSQQIIKMRRQLESKSKRETELIAQMDMLKIGLRMEQKRSYESRVTIKKLKATIRERDRERFDFRDREITSRNRPLKQNINHGNRTQVIVENKDNYVSLELSPEKSEE